MRRELVRLYDAWLPQGHGLATTFLSLGAALPLATLALAQAEGVSAETARNGSISLDGVWSFRLDREMQGSPRAGTGRICRQTTGER